MRSTNCYEAENSFAPESHQEESEGTQDQQSHRNRGAVRDRRNAREFREYGLRQRAMMLHDWFRAEFRLGFAQAGERCHGCKRRMETGITAIILRYYNEDAQLWGPPVETWHETCWDLLHLERMRADQVPRIGPGGGGRVRKDRASGEFDTTERWR